jgi:hypothetical protein
MIFGKNLSQIWNHIRIYLSFYKNKLGYSYSKDHGNLYGPIFYEMHIFSELYIYTQVLKSAWMLCVKTDCNSDTPFTSYGFLIFLLMKLNAHVKYLGDSP